MEHSSKIDTRNSYFKLPCEKCCYLIMLSEFGNEKAAGDPVNISRNVPKIKHLDAIK